MANTVTRELVEYAVKAGFKDLSTKVLDATKRLVLDNIGCACRYLRA